MQFRTRRQPLIIHNLPERLRALPRHTPPPGGWARLEARRRVRRGRYLMATSGLALAASVLVAVGLVGLRPGLDTPPAPIQVASAPGLDGLAQLIRRSQHLEGQLANARTRTVSWNGRRAAQAATLVRNLRVVDAQLTYADRRSAETLWQDRVQLLDALVDLHESEVPAFQYASYQY